MEELIPILVLVAYGVLSLLGRLARKGRSQTTGEPPEPSTVDRMLREMMQQAGIEPEAPVPEEHRPTRSEHRPTASEHRQSASETSVTASEHRPTPAEARLTPSEHAPRPGEHLPTPGEHLKGDLTALRPIPKLRPPRRKLRSPFADALASDLTGGARTLGRAIVLREILGPPAALRSPDER